MFNDKKKGQNIHTAQKDSIITHPNGSFTLNGVTYPNPIQDINPDALSFAEWFAAEMRHNPTGIGTWRGKQYKLEHKQFGGYVKGIGNWSGKSVPGMKYNNK